jgi:CTP:molybdopterin cytidylyltransferase MocA
MTAGGKIESFGVLLLAAGSSSRLGVPKQMLPFHGSTLIAHAVAAALSAEAETTWVVLGAQAGAVKNHIGAMGVRTVIHEGYEEGMASSLRAGLQQMLKARPWLDGVVVMVCDQPYLHGAHLRALVASQRATGAPVVASAYANRKGVPAVFHKGMFGALHGLTGDKGARHLIETCPGAESVPFPEGETDIDTAAEYEALLAASPGPGG